MDNQTLWWMVRFCNLVVCGTSLQLFFIFFFGHFPYTMWPLDFKYGKLTTTHEHDIHTTNLISKCTLNFYRAQNKSFGCAKYLKLWYITTCSNNFLHNDAGSWWLIFVKAKMWFGSDRDSASLSSSSRSLNLVCVQFLSTFFLRSGFGVLIFDSNCIFAWPFCFLSPTSSKDRWLKKNSP